MIYLIRESELELHIKKLIEGMENKDYIEWPYQKDLHQKGNPRTPH